MPPPPIFELQKFAYTRISNDPYSGGIYNGVVSKDKKFTSLNYESIITIKSTPTDFNFDYGERETIGVSLSVEQQEVLYDYNLFKDIRIMFQPPNQQNSIEIWSCRKLIVDNDYYYKIFDVWGDKYSKYYTSYINPTYLFDFILSLNFSSSSGGGPSSRGAYLYIDIDQRPPYYNINDNYGCSTSFDQFKNSIPRKPIYNFTQNGYTSPYKLWLEIDLGFREVYLDSSG